MGLEWRSWDLIKCISSVEVSPAAAGTFFFGKNDVPEILCHVSALLRSSRLPQAFFVRPQLRFYDMSEAWGVHTA